MLLITGISITGKTEVCAEEKEPFLTDRGNK